MEARKRARMVRVFALATLMVLGACQTPTPQTLPEPQVEPPPVVPTVPEKKPAPVPKPPPPPPPIAVLVSQNIPAYQQVADALIKDLDEPHIVLTMNQTEPQRVQEALEDLSVQRIASIGDNALRSAEAHADKDPTVDIIYAQVFAPQTMHRGVEALPPASTQLAYWRQLNPGLMRIGILGSHGFAPVIEEMTAAAKAQGIEVESQIVASDKQAWFEFRRILPSIDGFIFLPDPVILSPTAIQRMFQHGRKNNLTFLTYNALLYKLGADLHITQDPEDVAEQISVLLNDKDSKRQPLTTFKARTQGSEVFLDVNG